MQRPTKYKTLRGGVARIRWFKRLKHSGDYDIEKYNIRINSALTRGGQAGALLHELHHHCFDCITLSPRDHYTMDEIMADVTGRGMTKLWKDNPSLFAWIHWALTEGK